MKKQLSLTTARPAQAAGLTLLVGIAVVLGCAASAARAHDEPMLPPPAPPMTLAEKAVMLFGKQPGQSFNAEALSSSLGSPRTDTMTITLAPGKGAEVKAAIDAGQGFVFQWTASGEVLVDMHGELPDATNEYTSYDVGVRQRQGAGTWVAPFTGHHGWFWQNQGKEPVTVKVTVTGFQKSLFRPGKK
ncbi:MAG: hypothetical protein K9J82_00365 [Methylotenera sp.]|jgi:hypothetical protein|nr:hypothetical protein [Methylotenera sp.]